MILLDVREKDEVRAGYIEGAVTIPRGFLEFQVASQLPQTDKDIVVYCAGGVRSLLTAKEIRIRRDPDCPVCGEQPTITSLIHYEGFCEGVVAEPAVLGA